MAATTLFQVRGSSRRSASWSWRRRPRWGCSRASSWARRSLRTRPLRLAAAPGRSCARSGCRAPRLDPAASWAPRRARRRWQRPPIDRTIDDQTLPHPRQVQGGQPGDVRPLPPGNAANGPLPAGSAGPQRSQGDRRAGLIDEEQIARIDAAIRAATRRGPPHPVRGQSATFFERQIEACQQPAQM